MGEETTPQMASVLADISMDTDGRPGSSNVSIMGADEVAGVGASDEVGGIAFVTPTEGDALIVEKILGNKVVKRKKKERRQKIVLVPKPKPEKEEEKEKERKKRKKRRRRRMMKPRKRMKRRKKRQKTK